MTFSNRQHGFVAMLATLLVLVFMVTVGLSMSAVVAKRQGISTAAVVGAQSYYAAQAGAEDALLRLKNNPQLGATSYTLAVDGASALVTIPAITGSSRQITSRGSRNTLIKTVSITYSVDTTEISFHYGAQVGAGGLSMANSSRIQGNVYSNGPITMTGSASIDNDAIVAGNGNALTGGRILGSVMAHSCSGATIDGNLTYVVGGTNTCAVGGTVTTQSQEIPAKDLPVSAAQIAAWKSEAEAGGVSGGITLSGSQTLSIGPQKIAGDITLSNTSTLTVTGTLWVTGTITLSNTSKIKLDAGYGPLSGVIIADGAISPGNSSILQGSGQASSYLMLLSTNTSDQAIQVGNSATGAIFYASAGGISVSNTFSAKEVTGYKLIMSNNSIISYDSGLADGFFSSGPGGKWKVMSWQEQ
jgi:hypothetical protein